VLSALVGVTVFKIVPDIIWLSAPLAVVFYSSDAVYQNPASARRGNSSYCGKLYGENSGIRILVRYSPVLSGCIILLLVALFFNNITPNRSYPSHSRFVRLLKKKHSWA
jgi:CBS-domain-containing membrane protein